MGVGRYVTLWNLHGCLEMEAQSRMLMPDKRTMKMSRSFFLLNKVKVVEWSFLGIVAESQERYSSAK